MGQYLVFYLPKDSFFQAQTKFYDLETANSFINSDLFLKKGFRFDFLLSDKGELLKGSPKDNSEKHFRDAMAFAIPISYDEYLK